MRKTAFTLLSLLISLYSFSTDYYFSSSHGNNSNNGISIDQPLKSLSKIGELKLKAGDHILLKKGDVFFGTIELINISGETNNSVCLSSYGAGAKKPVINAKGKLNGILIQDCSHIKVRDIEITANGGGVENQDSSLYYMRCGVFITTRNKGNYKDISLENLYVRDVFFEEANYNRGTKEVLTGNGNQQYGWGIRVINKNRMALLSDILVSKCHIENVSHSGIRFTGSHSMAQGKNKNIENVRVIDNQVIRVGGPAMQASVVKNIEFKRNTTNYSGSPDDSRKWGRGSGLWVWGCLDAIIEHNNFRNANGPGDSAGCHIDFNNRNVIIQYNLSENNTGGFIEILGRNYNCTYRYNVSINDGSRIMIKGKTLGAGTMIGVNGYVGNGNPPVGPFNIYLYNNTIYVKEGIHPEVGFSKTTEGVLIANNIFYLEGHASSDERKQFQPESGPIPNIVFQNNLYLKTDNWPSESHVMITDKAPFYGDAKFVNKGGLEIKDYIPKNTELIKNKGIKIELIPTDTIGLLGGLKVNTDILGNKITGLPDMGAIEMKK